MAYLFWDPEDGVEVISEPPIPGHSPSAPPVPPVGPNYEGPLPTGYSREQVNDFLARNPGHTPGTYDTSRIFSALTPPSSGSPGGSAAAPVSGGPAPIAAFTTPFQFDASKLGETEGFKFRFDKAMEAINRGAAANGTLLTGPTQKALQAEASGLASQELDAEFGRQFATHGRAFDVHQFNEPMRFNSMRLNRLDDRAMFENDRNFSRGTFESDRAFGYGQERDRMNDFFRFTDYGFNAARR